MGHAVAARTRPRLPHERLKETSRSRAVFLTLGPVEDDCTGDIDRRVSSRGNTNEQSERKTASDIAAENEQDKKHEENRT